MNGKKAKLIRKLAGSKANNKPTQYEVVKHTVRERVVKNLLGEVIHKYKTGTFVISSGSRFVEKSLKKLYNKRTRG